jgi:hypothetical protein
MLRHAAVLIAIMLATDALNFASAQEETPLVKKLQHIDRGLTDFLYQRDREIIASARPDPAVA